VKKSFDSLLRLKLRKRISSCLSSVTLRDSSFALLRCDHFF